MISNIKQTCLKQAETFDKYSLDFLQHSLQDARQMKLLEMSAQQSYVTSSLSFIEDGWYFIIEKHIFLKLAG